MQNTSSLSPVDFLKQLLREGKSTLGQLLLRDDFSLRHQEDVGVVQDKLAYYNHPEAAREIARYDAEGKYRALKTAPNLKRGWLLQLQSLEEMLLAIDFLYPSALSLYAALLDETLTTTSLSETLQRQTGMYRVTQQLTDEQATAVIEQQCTAGCLRKILWPQKSDQNKEAVLINFKNLDTKPSGIPLLCREACNLFVAEARKVVKQDRGQIGVSPIIP